jgi:small-conductance mechanosensitive channel
MFSKSIYKIPNGKLVKINLEYDESSNKIVSIKITGDFFAYPEEAIDILEKELENIVLSKKILYNKINQIIESNNFEFIGVNSEGLTDGIMMCLK